MSEASRETVKQRLARRQSEVRELLRKRRGADGADAIAAQGEEGAKPLSSAQRPLWFFHRLAPADPVYNIPMAAELDGPLDVRALGKAFDEVRSRHAILRTRYVETSEGPMQVVDTAQTASPLSVVDLSSLTEGGRDRSLRRILERDVHRPFDLERGPVLRTTLVRLSESRHVLGCSIHHIAADHRSLEVLLSELGLLYEAFAQGRPSPLDPLPIQYADFAVWQHSRFEQDGAFDRQSAYWKAKLAGLETLELTTDGPSPDAAPHRGALLTRALSDDAAAAVRRLCRDKGMTPFMVLLGAFMAVLARHTGQSDVCVGTPVTNRSRSELQGLIGFFVNTLALRLEVRSDASFDALLDGVKATLVEALAHRDLPFGQLVGELGVEREVNRHPVFQHVFQVLPEIPGTTAAGVSIRPAETAYRIAIFDLHVALYDQPAGGFRIAVEYSPDLFEPTTIESLMLRFERFVTRATAQHECPIGEIPLLDEESRRTTLELWNRTDRPYPREGRLHDVFRAMAASRPDAISVVDAERCVTYRELDRRSDAVAAALHEAGVWTGQHVGIALGRSLEFVVGMLGIVKAGAAYVPLDLEYPRARLERLIVDAAVTTVLVDGTTEAALPDGIMAVDVHRAATHPGKPRAPDGAAAADLPAYVLFTSGSTGVPKGVVATHRNVLRLVCSASFARLASDETLLLLSALSFDAATLELWGPLLNGGRIVVAPPRQLAPFDIGRLVHAHGITTMWLTTGLFNVMVDECVDCFAAMRQVLTGGDAASPVHMDRFLRRFPECRLINGYGPTENTTFTACHDVSPGDVATNRPRVPIGRPIGNTKVFVLDELWEPVLPGARGVLYTGGDGVTLGYVGQPSLTASSFLPDPFASRPGARMYCSGDLVRQRRDGVLEFFGRRDGQVKVRGFRVELGEIETALASHPSVLQSTVIATNGGLAAFVVVKRAIDAPERALADELGALLRELLPEYMVPRRITLLDELPLTPQGKIDRRALRALAADAAPSRADYAAPRNPVERRLRELWQEVLPVQRVGVEDNFFEIGGHSLLATQLVSRIRSHLGVEIAVRTIFECPTIAGQAVILGRSEELAPTLDIARCADKERAPLSFAQQRLWFLEQLLPGTARYNVATALELEGDLNPEALRTALERVVARHEALRTTFADVDGEPFQRVGRPRPWALPVVDLRGLTASSRRAEVDRILEREAMRAFVLSEGPLLRTTLVRTGAHEHVLGLCVHHLVADGLSLELLWSEVAAFYAALTRGGQPSLPALTVQYPDYAYDQRQPRDRAQLQESLEYWKRRLDAVPPLRVAVPRPRVQTHDGASIRFRIPAATHRRLAAIGREHGATLHMVMLAGLNALLSRHTGQRDICVGSPVVNRSSVELEPLIGLFVNTVVFRTKLDPSWSFSELVRRVREIALEAYAHLDVPFERVVDEVSVPRDPSRTPLFQVLFHVLHGHQPAELAGLKVRTKDVDQNVARFDLEFVMVEDSASDDISGVLTFNRGILREQSAMRIANGYVAWLDAASRAPRLPVAEMHCLHDDDVALPERWNETHAEVRRDAIVPVLIDERAALHPDSTAVSWFGGDVSFAALCASANRMAHRLLAEGVVPGARVGVMTARSPRMLAAMLGIHKIGAAYVPLDPTYPAQRLGMVAADAGLAAVITDQSVEAARRLGDIPVIDVDACTDGRWPSAHPALSVSPDAVAYCIYTSGSTGRPKGVNVTHRNVANFFTAMDGVVDWNVRSAWLAITSISFDISVLELLWTLSRGIRVVLGDPAQQEGGDGKGGIAALQQLAADNRVTHLQCTPSMARMLLLLKEGRQLLGQLDSVLVGGEAWSRELGQQLSAYVTGPVINVYGPTETTVWSTSERLDLSRRELTIGHPVANTQTYILDEALQPVPIGAIGELCIAGEGVTLGYHRRAAATAERFLPCPFRAADSARMYCTGDLARYREDGRIEFLGRRDNQIKLRGYRIELGEVEAALERLPEVAEAAVALQTPEGGEPRLLAYVTLRAGASRTPRELRAEVANVLPSYAVPSAVVILDALPRTPNGKTDRRALAGIDAAPRAEAGLPPMAMAEQLLAQAFRELLGVEAGAAANFFELGGQSLLATQLVARVRRAFGVELPVSTVFEYPRLGELAQRNRRAQGARAACAAGRARVGRKRVPAVARPGATLVPDAARAGHRDVQHARRSAPHGPPGPREP